MPWLLEVGLVGVSAGGWEYQAESAFSLELCFGFSKKDFLLFGDHVAINAIEVRGDSRGATNWHVHGIGQMGGYATTPELRMSIT